MQRKLIGVIASAIALGVGASPAVAGGSGQAQVVGQAANTSQSADAESYADQNAVNANVPVSIGGGNVSGGTSSANQNASNNSSAQASNASLTAQGAPATQPAGAGSCSVG